MAAKKKRPILYIGKQSQLFYELGKSLPWEGHYNSGFEPRHFVMSLCAREIHKFVGRMKVGEVRELHVRLGKRIKNATKR